MLNQDVLSRKGVESVYRSLDILKKALLKNGQVTDLGSAAIEIIRTYARSWTVLNAFDENQIPYHEGQENEDIKFSYELASTNIALLKTDLMGKREASNLFGVERDTGLKQVLGSIHQTFDGKILYPSVFERAAHLFYFTIKDHPFTDGNKRIGSFLLLLYLSLYQVSLNHLTNESIIALALLVSQSEPLDKDLMIKLILNLINGEIL